MSENGRPGGPALRTVLPAASGPARPRWRRVVRDAEAEALLAAYLHTRDLATRNRLVLLHQPMVLYLTGRFTSVCGLTTEDLVQIGSIGLITALERYDPTRQNSFISFAVPTILGVMKHYMRDHTWLMRAPRRLRELGLSLRRHSADLEVRLGRKPTVEEMADAAGVSPERLMEAMDLDSLYQPASLDELLPEELGGGVFYWEIVGEPDPCLALVELRESLRPALERLEERQQAILHARFVEGAS